MKLKLKAKLLSFKNAYINNIWHHNQTDEPEVVYDTGNKRPNDENQHVLSKRRKTLADSDAGILSIDLTETPESSSDSTSPIIMPRSKRKKDKQNCSKIKYNHDMIEIDDDDNDESSSTVIDLGADDVEIVDSPARNLRSKALTLPSFHSETVKDRHSGKVENFQKPSGSKFQIPSCSQSYLTFSSVLSALPSPRNTRSNSFPSRTLKELNNKSSVSNGYPSEVNKKTASVTSQTANRTITRQSREKFVIDRLRKSKDRQAFLDLIKEYAYSPEAKQQSLSYRSPGSSLKQSSSSSSSRQSNRTFGTLDTKQLNFSSGLKKSNSPRALHCTPRYSTRLQTTHSGTPPIGSLAVPSSSSKLNFGTTVQRLSASPSSSKQNFSISLRSLSASPSSSKQNKSAVNKTVIDLTSEEDDEVQRQEIVSNVISSDYIRNLKTTFVGKDTKITGEDFIYNILKKYEASINANKIKVQKIQQQIRDNNDVLYKKLAETLERRLVIKEHEVQEEAEQKPAFELAPITEAMTAAINQIVASKKVPLVQIKDTSVKLQDIRTLEKCAWLNDEVINAYMNLIKMRAEAKPMKYPKVHCFNTFLYEQLQKKGYGAVRRWTKKIDIFDFNMLIIPIHLGNHWCLIQVLHKEKRIRYFDSMGSSNNLCLNSMMQYLVDEYKDKKNGNLNPAEWDLVNMPPSDIPQQRNMHDCGVFACTFAEHLTRLAPLNFSQDNMPYFRVKMMYEILTGELLL